MKQSALMFVLGILITMSVAWTYNSRFKKCPPCTQCPTCVDCGEIEPIQ